MSVLTISKPQGDRILPPFLSSGNKNFIVHNFPEDFFLDRMFPFPVNIWYPPPCPRGSPRSYRIFLTLASLRQGEYHIFIVTSEILQAHSRKYQAFNLLNSTSAFNFLKNPLDSRIRLLTFEEDWFKKNCVCVRALPSSRCTLYMGEGAAR